MREWLWEEWARRPRVALAMKAALAAVLAWWAVEPLGSFGSEYPYYAPLGAVVAVSGTVAGSLRTAAQTAGAIGMGAAVSLASGFIGDGVVALGTAVAVGTLVAGWRWLGEMGSWVPVSSLFILLVGAGDPWHYVLAYLGLTSMGAAIGLVINTVLPPLPLTPSRLALRALRLELAEQLSDVADGLEQPGPPTLEEWAWRRRELSPSVDRMRALVTEAAEARRANWRARRWAAQADRLYEVARALDELSALTQQVVTLVVEREAATAQEVALGPELRPATAAALRRISHLLTTLGDDEAFRGALGPTREAVAELAHATSHAWHDTGEDRFTAAAIVTALERAIQALVADHVLDDEKPGSHEDDEEAAA